MPSPLTTRRSSRRSPRGLIPLSVQVMFQPSWINGRAARILVIHYVMWARGSVALEVAPKLPCTMHVWLAGLRECIAATISCVKAGKKGRYDAILEVHYVQSLRHMARTAFYTVVIRSLCVAFKYINLISNEPRCPCSCFHLSLAAWLKVAPQLCENVCALSLPPMVTRPAPPLFPDGAWQQILARVGA